MNILFPAETKEGDSRKITREIDRDRRRLANDRIDINNQLSKLDTAAKALAKAGRTDELLIVAGQIASLRRQRADLSRADAQQQNIKNTIQRNARQDRNLHALQRSTAHLEASNASYPPGMAKNIAISYQKAIAKAKYNAEMVEEALEEDEDDDGEEERETGASIADEYMAAAGIQLASAMPEPPKNVSVPMAKEAPVRAAYAPQTAPSPLSSSAKMPSPPPNVPPSSEEQPASSAEDIDTLEERLRNIKRKP